LVPRPAAVAERACAGTDQPAHTATSGRIDDQNPKWCTATIAVRILEFVMNDVVERILNAYQTMSPLDAKRVADSRKKSANILKAP
jgi:hypothetical protein